MGRHHSAFFLVVVFFGLFCIHPEIHAQTRVGSFEVTGFLRHTTNAATGHANPNNANLVAEPERPLLLLQQSVFDLNAFGKLDTNWNVVFQPRLTWDTTKSADSHFDKYESLPSDFSGDGNLVRVGGDDLKFELSQAYVNYTSGNLWLRVGKQSIAWGETVAQRVLDVVNPLDLSQFFFFDRAREEFENIRIPQWFFRGAYTIPTDEVPDLTFEFLLNPGLVVPTILPVQGAPYNVLPSILKVTDRVDQGKTTFGMRVTGTLGDADFSLNFLTKPNDDGVGVGQGIAPDETGAGIPLLFLIGGGNDYTPYRILTQLRHPRIHIFGGSLNYFLADAGALLRFETTFTPNAPFTESDMATGIIERRVWKSVIQIDRPTYIIPGQDSMAIGVGYFYTYTGGDLSQARSSGATVDQSVHSFSVVLQQPLLRKSVLLELLAVYDTDDAFWLQPGIHWEIGNNIRLDLFYNAFGGAEKRAGRFGSFYWAEGLAFRFTYGF